MSKLHAAYIRAQVRIRRLTAKIPCDPRYRQYNTHLLSKEDQEALHKAHCVIYDFNDSKYFMPRRYIGVYEVTRHYGGPEEGGWWYNWYTYLFSVCVDKSSESRRERVIAALKAGESHRKSGNIYSVLGGVDVEVLYEEHPGIHQSTETPHYE